MNGQYENFLKECTTLFPLSAVYIIGIQIGEKFIPIYVGKSDKLFCRFRDYSIKPQFTTPTDFKVGEALEYLKEKHYKVVFKYKETSDRKMCEKSLIKELKQKEYKLLNDLPGYDYKTAKKGEERQAKEAEERQKVRNFIDKYVLPAPEGGET